VHDVGVDARPHRVELGEPAEQSFLLGEPTSGPLVEVVVGVDQARRRQAARPVDDPVRLEVGGHVAGTDRKNPVV
jgi:hypothetical protein